MNVSKQIVVTFEHEEADAIAKVLGKISDVDFRDRFGLSASQIESVHNFYREIPNLEDEE